MKLGSIERWLLSISSSVAEEGVDPASHLVVLCTLVCPLEGLIQEGHPKQSWK